MPRSDLEVDVNERGNVVVLVIHNDGTLDLVEVAPAHVQELADEADVAICMLDSGHGFAREGMQVTDIPAGAKQAVAWFSQFAMSNVQIGARAASRMMHGDRMRPVENVEIDEYKGGQYL